ncbi:TolC family protein [Paraglaciecola sp. L3A3]|uniref:TolC family protein n=1 Tax=Paraglaciecola sp. L3A3 TaxID=2686358 RepID=UPI00131D0555|nr:TolC family protein [Paraglaciecola sp. L3A3]
MDKFFVLTALLFFTACSSSVKRADLELPENQTIPATWFNATSSATTPNSQVSTPLLAIPTELQLLLQQAKIDNLSIKIALARLNLSQANNQASQVSLLPKLDATLGSRQEQVLNANEKVSQSRYSASFRASWELDLWQKLSNTRAATTAELYASEFDFTAAQQSVIGQILLRYLDIQEANELVYWSEQNLASQQHRVDITAQRLDSGLSSSQDYRLALNSLYSIQASLNQQRLSLNQAKQRFNLLLGRYPSAAINNTRDEINLPQIIELVSPQRVLKQRHDLVAAEYRLMSAHYRSKEAEKGYLPDINLGASFRANREDFSQLFDWKYWLASLTADLVQPIFNNGAIDAKIKQQKARQDLALAQYQQTLLTVWQEIEHALYAEQIQRQRFVALENAYEQIDQAEKRTIENYQNGLASSFELLNIQTRRISAKVNLIRSRFAILSNRVDLILALGEPFPISSET